MDDAALVHVVERIADAEGDFDRAISGQFFLFVQNGAQESAIDPLDDHVEAAAVFAVEGLDHAGMVELLPNLLFALEALEEHRVGFHLRKRDLDGHLPA